MTRWLLAFASGLLFGLGLVVSRMIDPAKVLGFLDLAGDWDPSLALVMLGALSVTGPGYALARHRPRPLCAERFAAPGRIDVDRPLMAGALLFGVGWGLVGYCPGPAIASVGLAAPKTLLFVAAMLIGMAVFASLNRGRAPSALRRKSGRRPSASAPPRRTP